MRGKEGSCVLEEKVLSVSQDYNLKREVKIRPARGGRVYEKAGDRARTVGVERGCRGSEASEKKKKSSLKTHTRKKVHSWERHIGAGIRCQRQAVEELTRPQELIGNQRLQAVRGGKLNSS